MVSRTLSVSIPEEQFSFLEENPNLSPSKVLQTGIENIQNSIKHNPQLVESLKVNQNLQKAIRKFQVELINATAFIEKKGLWGEFNEGL